MIGRSLEATFPPKQPPPADSREVLRVEGLTRHGVFEDVDLQRSRRARSWSSPGWSGQAAREVVRAIFGADPVSGGTVSVEGRQVRIGSPERGHRPTASR